MIYVRQDFTKFCILQFPPLKFSGYSHSNNRSIRSLNCVCYKGVVEHVMVLWIPFGVVFTATCRESEYDCAFAGVNIYQAVITLRTSSASPGKVLQVPEPTIVTCCPVAFAVRAIEYMLLPPGDEMSIT